MLVDLHIQHFALIDESKITFTKGLNVLSGETGAGKSIIIQAISLLLGGRASSDWIQTGFEAAMVEGVFDIEELPWVSKRLLEAGIEAPGHELLVRRQFNRQGKNRIFINGSLSTLAVLQKVAEGLVDLCSQHEHQSLLRPAYQTHLLDRFADHTDLLDRYTEAWDKFESAEQAYNHLLHQKGSIDREEFLKFQLAELDQANLQPNEEESLRERKGLLQSADRRSASIQTVLGSLSGDDQEQGAFRCIHRAQESLRQGLSLDDTLLPYSQALAQIEVQLSELIRDLDHYHQRIDFDEADLRGVQERLALIAALKRKHGATVSEILLKRSLIETEMEQMSRWEERLEAQRVARDRARAVLGEIGQELSASRAKAAKKLSKRVTEELAELKMEDVSFKVHSAILSEHSEWTARGGDDVHFLIATNAGHDSKPLSKIASGGELSRVLLAFRQVVADRGGIGVYLFDEIDSGMGGETAFLVGKKLSHVSKSGQVLCITHLPQVAAYSDHHLLVEKKRTGKATFTRIRSLDRSGKNEELARMLGGGNITTNNLKNARELIEMAKGEL